MRHFKTILVLLLFLASVGQAQVNISVQKGLESAEKTSALVENSQRHDLVIIASEHDAEYEKLVLDLTLLINQKDPRYNCKFWEEDSSLKDFLSTGVQKPYDEFYDEFYKTVYPLGKRFHEITNTWYMPMQIIPAKLRPLNEKGIVSVPVDDSFSDLDWITRAFEFSIGSYAKDEHDRLLNKIFLEERNEPLANNIEVALKSSACQKGVFSVGARHALYESETVKSVTTLLREKGFSVLVINLKP